jgi:hypothetical protein
MIRVAADRVYTALSRSRYHAGGQPVSVDTTPPEGVDAASFRQAAWDIAVGLGDSSDFASGVVRGRPYDKPFDAWAVRLDTTGVTDDDAGWSYS